MNPIEEMMGLSSKYKRPSPVIYITEETKPMWTELLREKALKDGHKVEF